VSKLWETQDNLANQIDFCESRIKWFQRSKKALEHALQILNLVRPFERDDEEEEEYDG